MDKETALYWKEVIKKVDQGEAESMTIYMEESKRRYKNLLPTIEEEIIEALHPTIQNPERETDGLPTRICEWP
jgi:hypothetical protein